MNPELREWVSDLCTVGGEEAMGNTPITGPLYDLELELIFQSVKEEEDFITENGLPRFFFWT